jgi:orotate phosphoribosyltransferase
MADFNKKAFYSFLIDHSVVGFNSEGITLKSGRTSYWYANCRNLTDRVGPAQTLVKYLLDFIENLNISYDFIYGVPEGITKLAVLANYIRGSNDDDRDQPLVMGRSRPKPHGAAKDRFFIGPVEPGQKIIVVEDVTTTGGSLIQTLEVLKESGLHVQCVIALFNRMQKRDDGKGVEQKLDELGYKYHAMADAIEFLPVLIKKVNPDPGLVEKLCAEMQETGVLPLKLA